LYVSDQDIRTHAVNATEMLSGNRPTSGNFLLYWLVNIFSGFSTKKIPSLISICFLIASAESLRYYLSKKHIASVINDSVWVENKYVVSIISALSLLFVFSIPIPGIFVSKPGWPVNHFFYIGSFAPNVWHNSTTLFVFPFAILLFYLSYRQLQEFTMKRNYWITLLILLNIFIKPSYFFVFTCVYPLFLLYKYQFRKEFWMNMTPVVVGLFCLLLEYYIIYRITPHTTAETSGVIFKPFYESVSVSEMFRLPISFFFSLLFPIIYSISNFSKIAKNELFWLIVFTQIISVIISLFIAESGPRASDGNFCWQIIITTWLCFFLSFVSLLRDYGISGSTKKNKLLFLVYFFHLAIGLVYYIRLFIVGTYC
jgi:hypothetical protein